MKNSKHIQKIPPEKLWQESWLHVKADVMAVAETLTEQATRVENQFKERIGKLEVRVKDLEQNINNHSNR